MGFDPPVVFNRVDGRHLVGWFGIALLLAAVAVYAEFALVRLLSGPVTTTSLFVVALETVLLPLPPLVLLYGATRLDETPYGEQGYHTVATWTAATGLVTLVVLSADVVHQLLVAEGLAPEFLALHTVSGLGFGGVLGFVVGRRTAAARHSTRQARAQRERFEFLNKLLRHHVLNRINVVDGYAGRLAPTLESEDRDSVATIREQAAAIADVVGDVRTVTDALAGGDASGAVDLAEVVREEIAALDAPDEVALEVSLPERALVASCGGLDVAVAHLLENAVEYNDAAEPRIDVTVSPAGPDRDPVDGLGATDEVVLVVADNGPGVPDAVRRQVADPGETGDQGFGLYLVHTVVENCGGTVDIRDRDGGGAEITVRLPPADV